jgi:hypothetical protein
MERIDVRYLENDTPQQIMRGGFKQKGRPRTAPFNIDTPKQLSNILNKPFREFTELERRAYNRLASRNTYAEELMKFEEVDTAEKYKEKLGKKIKDFNQAEIKEYNRLAKKESRIKERLKDR